ncbi:oxaloacetate decarboxylase subunit alpha [Sinanaerobacter chloroacetimidivorans]|uniref:Oxaloacetate decarboxylase subunit alpha n=1 Tax=Sinanaerobacter chloroacetimidivorans TaxID=2818044 RepID=A0A8J7W4H2_9FIRM|nr:oxaloacetate decarboxylase subunit alpha [Sinanaerobacter chloroacetimidivorans]MBR0600349.1 oxaloacetate decarboxylase subunit alpha [Sinanaerobacter chloroacetimidivorans]
MSKIKITETILRDGHQSLIATRMKTEEMLPILEVLDGVGYHALEMWGGATFDACLRFLNEDPWERLRTIRKNVKNTKLQMLLRGQNLLGYKHYADDVVDEFVNKAIGNGIDIIRIFDALNDTRNLQRSIEATKKFGGHAQGTISYTISPAHTNEVFIKLAKEIEDMGADSLCIKDMAGLLSPYNTYELVKEIKASIKIPLELHTHATSGLGSLTYMKAAEAGVDIIDTALSPFAEGTSQPPTEPFVAAFKGTEYDTGLNMELLNKAAEYFRPIREKYIASGLLDPKLMGVDINTLIYQVPGGMLSNLVSQLKQSNAMDKYEEVLKEVPRVREDLGYPPLVTPTSQIVGTQAVLNIVTGERYKMVPNEVKQLVKGMYGKTTVPIKDEIVKKIIGDEEVITCRPADLIDPELEKIKKEVAQYVEQDEDVLTRALFPQPSIEFFKYRNAKRYQIDSTLLNEEDMVYPV